MDHIAPSPHTLDTILDLGRLISSSLDIDVVLDRILLAARDVSDADMVSVMMLDDSGEELHIGAAYGLSPEVIATCKFRLGEGIAGWVALHGQAVHRTQLASDWRYRPVAMPTDACLLALPLRVRGRTLGVLNIARSRQGQLFEPAVVQMVEIIASQAAIAIENAATVSSLRFASVRERIAGYVHHASRSKSAVMPAAHKILADLCATLEDTVCIAYVPDEALGFKPFAIAPMGASPQAQWSLTESQPPPDQQATPWPNELQVRIDLPEGPPGWLVATPAEPRRLWRRVERELVAFSADQLALLIRNAHLVSEEQRSRDLSRTLSQLAAACNAMVGQASLLDFILEQLERFLPYDSSGVFLFHDDQYARMVAGRGFSFKQAEVVLYMGPGSLTWQVVQEHRAIYVPDVQLVPGWQAVPDADIIRSWIGAPLIVNDRIIGVLTIDKWAPEAFSEANEQIAQLFADHVAVAINNQRLLREAETRAAQLEVLHRASVRLGTIRAVRPMLNEVVRLLHSGFGYYQVYIGLVEGGEIVLQAAQGVVNDVRDFVTMQRYSVEAGLTGWVARHGEPLLVNNVSIDERFVPHPQTLETCAELVVPILRDGRVLGIIAAQSTTPGAFSQSDARLMEVVAGLTAMALETISHDEELRRAQESLVLGERLRAIGELASGVAHDFNNLLASILGHTQLLLAEQPDAGIADELRVIERAALDGAATVRRLQSFAQTNRVVPNEAISLSTIVAESLAITRPRWRDDPQSHGAQIVVVQEIGELRPFAGDGPALREMVMNLILNAVDAMPGGGTLRLRTSPVEAHQSPLGEPSALLEVTDTGVGMDEAVRARIFEPFFSTKGPAGTGMGLAMVYGIVQRHQGSVSVQSKPGGGTTFSIYLPARADGPEAKRQPVVAQRDSGALRVLIVDDDDAVRRVLKRHISRLGHVAVEVASGELALESLQAARYDLLCTDLGMPAMSGWELIERARGHAPHLATLLITGWGDQIDPDEARARGADAVIAKPFDTTRLQEVIDELRRQSVARQSAANE
jgi:signal transduction histidine kinase/ActR/RegA family two-component response regulator